MSDTGMAGQAVWRIGVIRRDFANGCFVTAHTIAEHDIGIEIADLQDLTVGLECECDTVVEAVDALDQIFADDGVMWRVAVITTGEARVRGVLPRVELIAHDMTVITCGGVVREIRITLGLHEREKPEPSENAHKAGQDEETRFYPARILHGARLLKQPISDCSPMVKGSLLFRDYEKPRIV
jgi:hypothetical protein